MGVDHRLPRERLARAAQVPVCGTYAIRWMEQRRITSASLPPRKPAPTAAPKVTSKPTVSASTIVVHPI